MRKILVAIFIATMMLMALSATAEETKSTTTTTPGFEATFAVAGILAVTSVALRRRH
ncbi:MAG: PGF-CTERM sorting domain-containing protein [Methanothrix sp.]|jgi:PGF-CTERM protein